MIEAIRSLGFLTGTLLLVAIVGHIITKIYDWYCKGEKEMTAKDGLNFEGRYVVMNGTKFKIGLNPDATPGNREERWKGTSYGATFTADGTLISGVIACWNENGECVWLQGTVDDVKNYDISYRVNPQEG